MQLNKMELSSCNYESVICNDETIINKMVSKIDPVLQLLKMKVVAPKYPRRSA